MLPRTARVARWTDRGADPALDPRMVSLALTLTLSCTLPVWLVGSLSVQMREELGFTLVQLGFAVAVFRGSAAMSAPFVSRLPDHIGPLSSMRLAAALATVSSLGIGIFARDYLSLVLCLALGGVSNALGQSSANLALVRAVKVTRQGFAFGLKQSALPLGSFVAGLAVPLIALTIGWRYAYLFSALIGIVIVFLVPRGASQRYARPGGATDLRRGPAAIAALFFALFLSAAASGALTTFLVESSVAIGIPVGAAGALLAAGSVLAVITRLVAGRMADRREGGHLRICAWMVAVGGLGFVLMALDTVAAVVVGSLVAFCFGWGFPGLFWFAIVRQNQANPAHATGILMPGPMLGGVFGPIAFGALVQATSYGFGWLVAALAMLIAASLMLLGRNLTAKQRSHEAQEGPSSES